MPVVTVFMPVTEELCRVIQVNTFLPPDQAGGQIWNNVQVFISGTDQETAFKLFLIDAGYLLANGEPTSTRVKLLTNCVVRRVETQVTNAWQFDLTSFRFDSPLTQLVFRSNIVVHVPPPSSSTNQWLAGATPSWPDAFLAQLFFRSSIGASVPSSDPTNQWLSGTASNWPAVVATAEYKRLITTYWGDRKTGR